MSQSPAASIVAFMQRLYRKLGWHLLFLFVDSRQRKEVSQQVQIVPWLCDGDVLSDSISWRMHRNTVCGWEMQRQQTSRTSAGLLRRAHCHNCIEPAINPARVARPASQLAPSAYRVAEKWLHSPCFPRDATHTAHTNKQQPVVVLVATVTHDGAS